MKIPIAVLKKKIIENFAFRIVDRITTLLAKTKRRLHDTWSVLLLARFLAGLSISIPSLGFTMKIVFFISDRS
jgi:hypothetical protein